MNYSTKSSFAEACIELARLRSLNYSAYILQMGDDLFEVRFWRTWATGRSHN